MFNRADKNKDGKISRVEIDYFFSAIGMQVSLEEIDEFVWKNDNDYDGQLNFEVWTIFTKMQNFFFDVLGIWKRFPIFAYP